MHKIPVLVVDDFFEDPYAIRDYALSLKYNKTDGVYPGVRSELLNEVNPVFFNDFSLRLFSLLFDFRVHGAGGYVEACFQLITEDYQEGWVHSDLSSDDWSMAGVIYLTPDAPLAGGTSLYRLKSNINPPENKLKQDFYNNNPVNLDTYKLQRNAFNECYERTLEVGNVFNRLVMYNTSQFHKGDTFFGNSLHTGRLTLVFFAKINMSDNVSTPIERMQDYKITEIKYGTT